MGRKLALLSQIAVLSVVTITSAPTPAHALKLFGRCIIGPCQDAEAADAAQLIDPKRYDVALDFASDNEAVQKAVKSASALWQGRDKAVGGSAGVIARAKGDYRRILAGLYNEGHYAGSISIKINGAEASDLPVGTEFVSGSTIAITVDAGDQYQFGRADIIGAAPETNDKKDKVPTFTDVGFAAGLPALAGSVGKAAKIARDAWRQQGYATAKVTNRTATAVHPEKQLNVEIEVESGGLATYGDVEVTGTERMDAAFTARQTGLVKGEEYDPDDLVRAQKRLDRLGVFSTQKLEEADTLNADGSLPLSLTVKERKLRRIGLGATLSSIDGAGIETYWLHRNLFGKAERLRIDASVGGLGSTFDYQKFDYNFGAAFTKPGIFTPDTDLNFTLFAKREVNENYTETSGGGSASLTYYYSDKLTLDGGIFAQYSEFERAKGVSDFTIFGLDASAIYDGRNNKLNPTTGYYFGLDLKPFYEFTNANFGFRSEAEARAYLPFGEDDQFVLAGRLKVGSVVGPARDQTPDNLLFFAGGGGSVRGYGFKNIGVVEPGGSITGGRSAIETSLEARLRFNETFGAVAFADAGTVSANSIPTFEQDLKVGLGIGVRYFTSLGPIRLDVAIPMNKQANDPRFGLYAGIGQAF